MFPHLHGFEDTLSLFISAQKSKYHTIMILAFLIVLTSLIQFKFIYFFIQLVRNIAIDICFISDICYVCG